MFFIYFTVFIFGLCIGSFLNAWIWRLHRAESMFGRRSYCPKCKKQIKNFDLVPVLSFLFLGGKCRGCKKKISWQYPLVELAVGLLYLLSFKIIVDNFDISLLATQITLFIHWYFIAILVLIFVFDLKYYLILNKVTLPSIVIVFLVNLFLGSQLKDLFFGILVGGGFFLLQYKLPEWGRSLFGKKYAIFQKDWIGGGDIRLGVLIGVMFGLKLTVLTLFIAYIGGGIIGVGLLIFGTKKMDSQLPFGTFLSISAIIVLFWGGGILEWYRNLTGIG